MTTQRTKKVKRKADNLLIYTKHSIKYNNNVNRKIVYVYSNLPSGGALEIKNIIDEYLSSKVIIKRISDESVEPHNFLSYLYDAIFKLPPLHKKIATKINSQGDVLLAYQSWITKSPILLRHVNLPKVYICQEPPREFYDFDHIKIQSIKDRLVNILRLPIKFIDKENLKSDNLTVISNSEHSKRLIDRSYNIESTVIYPGINTSEFKSKSYTQRRNQVITVGAINKYKGQLFIINAISCINKELRPRVVMVSNGSDPKYQKKLISTSKKLGVKVKILHNISKTKLANEYANSKLFLYSPVNEPFGIVILEAMASGLPIVAYRAGGYSEILSESNGYLFNTKNTNSWALKITELLTNNNQWKQISGHNLKYVRKKFNSMIMCKKIENIIEDL